METTIMGCTGIMGYILGLYRDSGKTMETTIGIILYRGIYSRCCWHLGQSRA